VTVGTLAWLIAAYCLADLVVTGSLWPGLAASLAIGAAFWLSPRLARNDLSLVLRRYELVRMLSTQGLLAALVAYLAWWQASAFGPLPSAIRVRSSPPDTPA
jgi:hypothetical protein